MTTPTKTPIRFQTPFELFPSYGSMSLREKRFFRELIECGNPTEAAARAWPNSKRSSARHYACSTLKKHKIKMTELMDQMGLDLEEDIKDLIRLRKAKETKFFAHEGKVIEQVDVEDNGTQLKALELTCKIKGHLKERVVEVNNHIEELNVTVNHVELEERLNCLSPN